MSCSGANLIWSICGLIWGRREGGKWFTGCSTQHSQWPWMAYLTREHRCSVQKCRRTAQVFSWAADCPVLFLIFSAFPAAPNLRHHTALLISVCFVLRMVQLLLHWVSGFDEDVPELFRCSLMCNIKLFNLLRKCIYWIFLWIRWRPSLDSHTYILKTKTQSCLI